MESELCTVRVRITGRVQGVGYRHWTQGEASELRLAGWVRNRSDGSVEALIAGPARSVAAMLRLCDIGPPGALVSSVDVLEEGGDPPQAGFVVLPTV
jgi:acylphosphatase